MLNTEQNELITRIGPGTPGGNLMRCYWQPAALSRELKDDEPLAVTLLGEALVMFRDGKGWPQLIGRACPHRATDLTYARVESGGLRCIYHGWLMDGRGRCVHQPSEPAGSAFKDAQLTAAYPCHEAGGLILAYMGGGEPPVLPGFHFLSAPESQTFVMKVHHECSYLQSNEGNIDPQHLSFLHRFLRDGVPGSRSSSDALNEIVSNDPAPEIRVDETAYGLRISTARAHKPGSRWVRITNFVMPNGSAIHGSPVTNPRTDPVPENCAYQINWHVPIDDGNHWKYVVAHRFDGPVDTPFMLSAFTEVGSDFTVAYNRENRYRQNRAEMKSQSFAGLGPNFFVHDKCATESQGVIMDRSNEHLVTTDRAIMRMRKQLLEAVQAVQAGHEPLMVERDGAPPALAELTVLSTEVADDVELSADWWRPYFEGNRPKPKPPK